MLPKKTIVASALAIIAVLPALARAQSMMTATLSSPTPEVVSEFRAGWADQENFDGQSAAAHFKAALDRDANFGLARVLYAFNSPDLRSSQATMEANRGVADAAKANTNELLLAMAFRELVDGRNAPAQTLFRAAAELMPTDLYVVTAAANLLPAPDPATTVTTFKALVSKYPDYGPLYNTLAYSLWAAGDHAGALEAAKKQVELTPKNPNAHDTYAEILEWSGSFADAATHYGHAISMTPSFTEAYIGAAEVEALQGRGKQARDWINKAIANTSGRGLKIVYMRDMVSTYALEGNISAERSSFESVLRAAEAQNDSITAAIIHSQMAAFEGRQGNVAVAHAHIARATALNPAGPPMLHYFAAMAHANLHHWPPANTELTAAKAAQGSDAPAVRNRLIAAEGFFATEQKRPAEALAILMKGDTTDVLIMSRIAEAHAALGHRGVAAAWNARITGNYALNLLDFPAVNARARARAALSKKK